MTRLYGQHERGRVTLLVSKFGLIWVINWPIRVIIRDTRRVAKLSLSRHSFNMNPHHGLPEFRLLITNFESTAPNEFEILKCIHIKNRKQCERLLHFPLRVCDLFYSFPIHTNENKFTKFLIH